MRAFFAHLWKEQREHRLMLAAIGAAIVLLTAAGAWAFHDKVFEVERGSPFYVAACTALAMFALSTELFAAEGRRDGFAFLRRVPRGLGTAWAAKIVFYVLACALASAFGAATLLLVTQIAGGSDAVQRVLYAFDSDAVLLYPALVVTLGLWILCVSLWVPRGAAAAGAALLLLAALAAPVYFSLRANPAFEVPKPWLVGVGVGLVLVPLFASLLGLLRGLRAARNSWSAAWRGLALVLLVAAPSYAAGSAHLEKWGDLQADEPHLFSYAPVVGRGGRYAYVNLARPNETIPIGRGYPAPLTRAFRLDLQSGEALPMAPLGSYVSASLDMVGNGSGSASRPVGIVSVYRIPDDGVLAWWNAETGQFIKKLPYDVVTDDVLRLLREDLRLNTRVHTPEGRPAWLLRRRYEHEEADGGVASVPLPGDIGAGWCDGIGWMAYDRTSGREGPRLLVPGARGEPTVLPWSRGKDRQPLLRLTSRSYVTRANRSSPWEIDEGETSTRTTALDSQDEPFLRVDDSHALVWRKIDLTKRALRLADFAAGTSLPVALPTNAPAGIGSGWHVGTTPAGRSVLRLYQGEVGAFALFDPIERGIVSWTPAPSRFSSLVATLDESSAIVAVSDGSNGIHLVRLTFGTGTIEALYPRH